MVLSVIKVRSGCVSVASKVFKEKNKQTAISTVFNIADILRSLFLSLVEEDLWRLAVSQRNVPQLPGETPRDGRGSSHGSKVAQPGLGPALGFGTARIGASLVVRGGKASAFGAAAGRSWPAAARLHQHPGGATVRPGGHSCSGGRPDQNFIRWQCD